MNQQAKDRTRLMTEALLLLGKEDARGFRALTGHRPDPSFKLLERRGLIYRTMSCEPVRCQYRYRHGSVPTGDCRREGFVLSLRGRLVIELLWAGMRLEWAMFQAAYHEREYTATTIIHRCDRDLDGRVILGDDLPPLVLTKRERNSAAAPQSEAERSIAEKLERIEIMEKQLGDMVSRIYQARAELEATWVDVEAIENQMRAEAGTE